MRVRPGSEGTSARGKEKSAVRVLDSHCAVVSRVACGVTAAPFQLRGRGQGTSCPQTSGYSSARQEVITPPLATLMKLTRVECVKGRTRAAWAGDAVVQSRVSVGLGLLKC